MWFRRRDCNNYAAFGQPRESGVIQPPSRVALERLEPLPRGAQMSTFGSRAVEERNSADISMIKQELASKVCDSDPSAISIRSCFATVPGSSVGTASGVADLCVTAEMWCAFELR